MSEQAIPATLATAWEFSVPRNDWHDPEVVPYQFKVMLHNAEQAPATVVVEAQTEDGNLGEVARFTLEPNATREVRSNASGGEIPDAAAKLVIVSDRLLNAYETAGPMDSEQQTIIEGTVLDPERLKAGERQTAAETTRQIQVSGCCGYSSSGNPYPCSCSSKPNTGNCTWWAWKKARDEWGRNLPGWGDARYWADRARTGGYPVKSTAKAGTIAVSSTYNHVCWVIAVSGSTVTCSEMNWCLTCKRNKNYSASFFNKGFIYKR
jgi:surface antigen